MYTCWRRGKIGPSKVQRLERAAMKNGFRPGVHEKRGLYVGNWEDDVKQGKGRKTYKNKTVYEGDWLANKRHGFGVLMKRVDDHYEFVCEGQWINNRFVDGVCYEEDGVYEGDLSASGARTKCGYGTMWWNDGTSYRGQWRDNEFDGRGRHVEANGNIYDGQWRKGVKHGEGVYIFRDRDTYLEGVWIDGVPKRGVIRHLQWLREELDVSSAATGAEIIGSRTLPEITKSDEECIRNAYEHEKSETLERL